MYVINAKISDGEYVSFNNILQEHLIKKEGIPVIRYVDGKAYFRKTKALSDSLMKIPTWMRIFSVGKEVNDLNG